MGRASNILLRPSLPSTYLLVPVEPVGGGPGEAAQVSQQPLPPQVELDGLQQPQGQTEHERQVKGPRPAGLQPGGVHRSALQIACWQSPGAGERVSFLKPHAWRRFTQPTASLGSLGSSLLPNSEGRRAVGVAAQAWPEEAGASSRISNPLSIDANLHSG